MMRTRGIAVVLVMVTAGVGGGGAGTGRSRRAAVSVCRPGRARHTGWRDGVLTDLGGISAAAVIGSGPGSGSAVAR